MHADILDLWTVYDHPSDYPDVFVARLSQIKTGGLTVMTSTIVTAATLEGVRDLVQARYPYVLTSIPRAPEDDPVIVECLL